MYKYVDKDGTVYSIQQTDSVEEDYPVVIRFIQDTYDKVFTEENAAQYKANMDEAEKASMAFSITVNDIKHGFIYLRRLKANMVYVDSLYVSKVDPKCKILLMDFILSKYNIVRYVPVDDNIKPILSLLNPKSVFNYFNGKKSMIKSRSRDTLPSTERLLEYLELEEV